MQRNDIVKDGVQHKTLDGRGTARRTFNFLRRYVHRLRGGEDFLVTFPIA